MRLGGTCRPTPPRPPISDRYLLGYFRKDLEKGDRMEATYVPGVARLPANSLLIHHGKDNRRHQWFTGRLDSFNTHICLWVVS